MEEYQIFGIGLVLIIILMVWQMFVNARKQKKKMKDKIHRLWGNLPDRTYQDGDMEAIRYYHEHAKTESFSVDDITWNDLDMDMVFAQLNHTWTSAGEEYLYHILHTPSFSNEELEKKDALADYFAAHEQTREEMQWYLASIGRTRRLSISEYMNQLTGFSTESSIFHYLCIVLMAAAIVSLFVMPEAGVLFVVGVIIFNMLTYYRDKAKAEPYFICLEYLARMIKYGKKIKSMRADGALKEELERLDKVIERLAPVERGARSFGTNGIAGGNPFQIVWDYILILLHLDLIRFNATVNLVQENKPYVDRLLEEVGKLELGLLTASYRSMMPYSCVPKLNEQKEIAGEKMYHPLLQEPVPNSIHTDRPVLLTGSNASGKSTFLKTMAINALLAQTIHTVLAESYRGPFVRVYSSMALRDSIESGESYYIVEIKSLKRILDAAKQTDTRVLCFVDEVLRGTNTVERIASSSQILKSLALQGVFCFAATHDIELTELLKTQYANYHFEEDVQEGDVIFDYKLREGKATTRNAIKLLSIMGYGSDVIAAAEKTAAHFLETGDWIL